ncbi:hypothetical protein OPV22_001706 [Ensete ventricosum]|uniref:Uncharacterized protein n=1 Tax=Ensete ventricosum TaxID=4639 RepID=A0AAV8RQQ6_ENSVE|nr:hypothetical protein OPV22_001706 [Ensete ventricosum]
MSIAISSSVATSIATATFAPLTVRRRVHRTKTLGASPPIPNPLATACRSRLGFSLVEHNKAIYAPGNEMPQTSIGSPGGPPLPTILAGVVVVFLLLCWVVGSIAMWLVGFIVLFEVE